MLVVFKGQVYRLYVDFFYEIVCVVMAEFLGGLIFVVLWCAPVCAAVCATVCAAGWAAGWSAVCASVSAFVVVFVGASC